MSGLADPSALIRKRCVPCEGGILPLDGDAIARLLPEVPGWSVGLDGRSLHRGWTARNFATAAQFFAEVAILAEDEGHHPDFHLTGYREVAIDLTTHAVGGLTENDFILAAKIDAIPFEARPRRAPGH